jgi:hypothetical protein
LPGSAAPAAAAHGSTGTRGRGSATQYRCQWHEQDAAAQHQAAWHVLLRKIQPQGKVANTQERTRESQVLQKATAHQGGQHVSMSAPEFDMSYCALRVLPHGSAACRQQVHTEQALHPPTDQHTAATPQHRTCGGRGMPLLLLAPNPAAFAVPISPAGVRSLLRPN